MNGLISWLKSVGDFLDSPLSALAVLVAAAAFLVNRWLRPLWRKGRRHERHRIRLLESALTYDRFLEVIGLAPRMQRETGLLYEEVSEMGDRESAYRELAWHSQLFILPRTYVEVFVDERGRVLGYTVTLRGRSRPGVIEVAGLKVRLGSSDLVRFWDREIQPTLLATASGAKVSAFFEVSTPLGATMGRAWAAGSTASGGRFVDPWESYDQLIAGATRVGLDSMKLARAKGGHIWLDWYAPAEDYMSKTALRRRGGVNCVAVSTDVAWGLLPAMLTLHPDHLGALDPGNVARRQSLVERFGGRLRRRS